jgi:hypothetical protein
MDRSTSAGTADAIGAVAVLAFGLFVLMTFSRVEIVSNDSAQYVGLSKA